MTSLWEGTPRAYPLPPHRLLQLQQPGLLALSQQLPPRLFRQQPQRLIRHPRQDQHVLHLHLAL